MTSKGSQQGGGGLHQPEFAHQDELMKGGEYHPLFGMLSIVEFLSVKGVGCLVDRDPRFMAYCKHNPYLTG